MNRFTHRLLTSLGHISRIPSAAAGYAFSGLRPPRSAARRAQWARLRGLACAFSARNRSHGLATKVFLRCALATVTLQAGARVIDKTVVTVNDEVILESDIDRFVKQAKSKSFQEFFGGIKEEQLKDRKAVLALLIDEKIINQQVKKSELVATDQEVDGQIRAIEKRNNITKAQLASRLQQLGTSINEYREGIRRQIERGNLIEREVRPSRDTNDEALQSFYSRMPKSRDEESQFRISHILIEEKKGKPAKSRADEVWKEVNQAPEKFPEVAREVSDDLSTSTSGGDLGFFSLASMSTEFKKVVPKTPVGSVTAPIKTPAGYHIIKVVDRRSGDFASLSPDRKAEIRELMLAEEVERKMELWLERKKRDAHIRYSLGNNP